MVSLSAFNLNLDHSNPSSSYSWCYEFPKAEHFFWLTHTALHIAKFYFKEIHVNESPIKYLGSSTVAKVPFKRTIYSVPWQHSKQLPKDFFSHLKKITLRLLQKNEFN